MRYLYLLLIVIGCSRKTPQIIYNERVTSHIDTINFVHVERDSIRIPCEDFRDTLVSEKKDTVIVEVVKNRIKIKTVTRRDSIFLQPNIISQSNIKVRKIDNSVTAKKGGIIGDGNTQTTNKTNWWWIFLAGMLTQFIVSKILRSYFPFLKFL